MNKIFKFIFLGIILNSYVAGFAAAAEKKDEALACIRFFCKGDNGFDTGNLYACKSTRIGEIKENLAHVLGKNIDNFYVVYWFTSKQFVYLMNDDKFLSDYVNQISREGYITIARDDSDWNPNN